jgi:GGDEF domain-containing protein
MNASELIKKVDTALYQAKEQWLNGYQTFTTDV